QWLTLNVAEIDIKSFDIEWLIDFILTILSLLLQISHSSYEQNQ
ncbi:unnamed protein product, partial [Rotaria magnacalcarata]